MARIERRDSECKLIGPNGNVCQGFILARSPGGHALTRCDLNFHLSTDGRHPSRIVFSRTDQHLNDKVAPTGRAVRVSFQKGEDGYREFWHMIAFLYRFKEIVDLGEFAESYQVVVDDDVVRHLNSYDRADRADALASIADRADIDSVELSDLLLLRRRRATVKEFAALLTDSGYCENYRSRHGGSIKGNGEEAIWHHFLSSNRWIFRLSLNLRFIEDFVDEATVGTASTANRGNPKADMLGWSDYTILVELKTPSANIFTDTKSEDARAGTWSFTTAFIEGISQCLAQRSGWETSYERTPVVVTDINGTQQELDKGIFRTVDPQAIFIIGNKEREIPRASSSVDVRSKRDTLERFSRNSRNISILTYDELYGRAYYIAYGTPHESLGNTNQFSNVPNMRVSETGQHFSGPRQTEGRSSSY